MGTINIQQFNNALTLHFLPYFISEKALKGFIFSLDCDKVFFNKGFECVCGCAQV